MKSTTFVRGSFFGPSIRTTSAPMHVAGSVFKHRVRGNAVDAIAHAGGAQGSCEWGLPV